MYVKVLSWLCISSTMCDEFPNTNLAKRLKRVVGEDLVEGEDVERDEAWFMLSWKEVQIQVS